MEEQALYKNEHLATQTRVIDLLGRMTLTEKAGLLFHSSLIATPDFTGLVDDPEAVKELVVDKNLSHFNLYGPITDPRRTVEWVNDVQRLAVLHTRLGIPVTFSTDPRNHFNNNIGTTARAGCLSQWPETLGFAALRDPALVEPFTDIARREYLALGIRLALSPQADLATEYRWSRINTTWGESAELAASLTERYIRGFQAPHLSGGVGQLGPCSVSTMTKHFPGAGPERDGEDSHFIYGQDQIYPGNNFEYHLILFRAAIQAGTRQMMPYYSKPVGLKDPRLAEEVGFGFHRGVITTLLKEELNFDGIVCSD